MLAQIKHSRRPATGGLGVVQAGGGGSAGDFTFYNGLSQDSRLAYYLQDLTPSQLQDALAGKNPSAADIGAFDFSELFSCSNPAQYDASICGPGGPSATSALSMNLANLNPLNGATVPGWALIAGAGVGLLLLVKLFK